MKHLFFDIECANCDEGKGKICSFGYVFCDEDLNILKKRDIIINPDAPFHLTGRRDKRDIVLSYPEEVFLSAPKFPAFQEEIFSLLTGEGVCVWGYAVINDVNFLLAEGERYRVRVPDFTYYDVQLLYADYLSVKNVMGLERAVNNLGIKVSEEHNSCEDALNTMLVAKGMCEDLGVKLETLMEFSPRVKGEVKGGERIQYGGLPKKKAYDLKRAKLMDLPVEFGNKSIDEVKKSREKCFDIFHAERKVLHNYDSGVSTSSTIGELLGKITLGEE